MRTYPTDESDIKEAARLEAPPWMVAALKMNPSYPYWGNHEDYMTQKDGWGAQEVESVAHLWSQDELNELVHGYYFIDRKTAPCGDCGQSGYNPATRKISDDWYGNRNPKDRWDTNITHGEVASLVEEGRLRDLTKGFNGYFDRQTSQWMVWQDTKLVPYEGIPYIPTPEEVNTWAKGRGQGPRPRARRDQPDDLRGGPCQAPRGVWQMPNLRRSREQLHGGAATSGPPTVDDPPPQGRLPRGDRP